MLINISCFINEASQITWDVARQTVLMLMVVLIVRELKYEGFSRMAQLLDGVIYRQAHLKTDEVTGLEVERPTSCNASPLNLF